MGEGLAQLPEAARALVPAVVYAQGDLSLLRSKPRVAVLGSKRPSMPALKRAVRFARELTEDGVIVVSGMSEGVNTAAHGSALDSGGRSIAVLATGHDVCFPKTSEYLQRTLASKQLVLSGQPRGRMAQREGFVSRDQLIALISDAVVVVEAQDDSGTLRQAREALRFGRPLFLMASILEDPRLKWPAELLGQGAKTLAEAAQVLEVLPRSGEPSDEEPV